MDRFRESMYDACLQMGMAIVPTDIAARVMAFVYLQGGDERMTASQRMKCEIKHIQKKFHIDGGEVPDKDFVVLLQRFVRELQEYTDSHKGEWPLWLNELIEERYGFKPYVL